MSLVKKDEGAKASTATTAQKTAERAADSTVVRTVSLVQDVLTANHMKDLSPEGEKYLESLVTSCEKADIKYVIMPSTNTHLFIKDKNVYALIFSEHIREANKTGCDLAIAELNNEFIRNPDFKKLGAMVATTIVHKTDYDRVNNMAKNIQNTLKYAFYPCTLEDITQGQYRVNTNLMTVRDELARMSPHGVPSRVDYGFVLELADTTNEGLKSSGLFNRFEPKWVPMAAVGAYTDIVRSPGARRMEEKFMPIIHISDIQSNIRSIRMLPVLMGIALDAFYTNAGWMSPFMSFTKGTPNLGSLYFSPDTNAPEFLTNQDQVRNFCLAMVEDPVLVMDIQPGRATLPGIEYLVTDIQPAVMADLLDFFNPTAEELRQLGSALPTLVERPITMLSGLVETDGQWVDSRCIDYFKIIESQSDRGFLEYFLNYSDRPDDRFQAISDAGYKSMVALYNTNISPVNLDSLEQMVQLMGSSLSVQRDYAETTQSFTGSALVARSQKLRDLVAAHGSIIKSGYSRRPGAFFGEGNAWSSRFPRG